jgi:alpha-mannosidase
MAKFEVCGHKFVDLSEYGYGVAVFNDWYVHAGYRLTNSKYGHAVHGNTMSMSLLRAPKAPDGNCDIGVHEFKYVIHPHVGGFSDEIVKKAYQYNAPPVIFSGLIDFPISAPFNCSVGNMVIDSVKMAEDGSGIIMRAYESVGGRGTCTITWYVPYYRFIN